MIVTLFLLQIETILSLISLSTKQFIVKSLIHDIVSIILKEYKDDETHTRCGIDGKSTIC